MKKRVNYDNNIFRSRFCILAAHIGGTYTSDSDSDSALSAFSLLSNNFEKLHSQSRILVDWSNARHVALPRSESSRVNYE
ncbi:hypothetical protein BELL_0167g00020 [Botrytis elliptica]|uniref:Uncharacterized protein n=1 Tax=Botrytis elliptica TaxID=278938 RepID=A0A4Z1K4J3_9HELO|nr:hypothetical protein BELL_0167g00020 [Botrytis elliptica]